MVQLSYCLEYTEEPFTAPLVSRIRNSHDLAVNCFAKFEFEGHEQLIDSSVVWFGYPLDGVAAPVNGFPNHHTGASVPPENGETAALKRITICDFPLQEHSLSSPRPTRY
jgi:hypothetical protein